MLGCPGAGDTQAAGKTTATSPCPIGGPHLRVDPQTTDFIALQCRTFSKFDAKPRFRAATRRFYPIQPTPHDPAPLMSASPNIPGTRPPRPSMKPLPAVIFMSRWLQVPLYLGLIVAQGVYVVLFLKEVWHLVTHMTTLDETNIMLVVLGLIDVVMISNLLIMVIVGGYEAS